MSKLHLIQEIQTAVKMSSEQVDNIKLAHYLDDLLSNYEIEAKDYFGKFEDNEKYIQMFLGSIKIENYSRHTLLNYNYELRRFSQFLNNAEKSILQATTADVRQYLSIHGHLMQSTIVTKLDILSSFYGWLVKEDELLKNPCAKIKRPKLPKKVRIGLTIIELELVRAACTKVEIKKGVQIITMDVRKRALIEIFYSTGCRLDELRKLNIDDIDWESSSVIVNGKGNKDRRVFLSEKAKYYLKQYLESRDDDCPALIASDRTPIRRLTNAGIQYQVKKIKEVSGIDKPLHPHIMRHTFAQLSLDNGMELADLQALMGHESADTTIRYAQVSDERKRSAFNKFHAQ